jgi:hypothetical protein
MDANRAKEQPLEYHGDDVSKPDSVKDWHADRLALAIHTLEIRILDEIAERKAKGLATERDVNVAFESLKTLKSLTAKPHERAELATLVESIIPQDRSEPPREGKAAGPELAAAAFIASVNAHRPTYLGFNTESCQSGSPLEQACNRAHALVEKGYIDSRDLMKLEVAVLDRESHRERAGSALYRLSVAAGMPFSYTVNPVNHGESSFSLDTNLVTVGKQQSLLVFPNHDIATAAAEVFAHEFGHYLSRHKLLEMVDTGVQALESRGGIEGIQARQFIDVPDPYLKVGQSDPETFNDNTGRSGFIGRDIGQRGDRATWVQAAGEMYGDCLMIVSEKAMHGNDAAIKLAHELIVRRDQMHGQFLSDAQLVDSAGKALHGPFYGAIHHTSEALETLIDAIKDGRLDVVSTPKQLDALIGEAMAKGLIAEYTQVRTAELNLWHLRDGAAVPGLPASISKEAMLLAELKSNLNDGPGRPKFIIPNELIEKLPEGASTTKMTVINNDGNYETLTFSSMAPVGTAVPEGEASLTKNSGIEGLKQSVAQNAEEHLKELPHDPGKPLEPALGEQQADKAESEAPEPQAEIAM